jgi:hypothetical protein
MSNGAAAGVAEDWPTIVPGIVLAEEDPGCNPPSPESLDMVSSSSVGVEGELLVHPKRNASPMANTPMQLFPKFLDITNPPGHINCPASLHQK